MKKLLVLLFFFTAVSYSGDSLLDSLGYRYYHDLDNEHDGSKFRAYATKSFIKVNLNLLMKEKEQVVE